MASIAPIASSIIVDPLGGAEQRLKRLLELFAEAEITVEIVSDAEDAVAQFLASGAQRPCVLLDASGNRRMDAVDKVFRNLETLRSALPNVEPIVIGDSPDLDMVIGCFRAGAGDFVDITIESDPSILEALERYARSLNRREKERDRLFELRTIVEEFLKDLVKTERRSIDLEHQLAVKERRSGQSRASALDSDRDPTIIIIEDDREVADLLVDELEGADLATYAFVNGEDAVLEVTKMTNRKEAIDLAIVDANLPGINGLEAIRQMREIRPGLAAILMTGYSTQETAVNAADLGVVGYVLKPFDDVGGLVTRIKEQAIANRDLARERHYLSQIKERHDSVLTRYRQLVALMDQD